MQCPWLLGSARGHWMMLCVWKGPWGLLGFLQRRSGQKERNDAREGGHTFSQLSFCYSPEEFPTPHLFHILD